MSRTTGAIIDGTGLVGLLTIVFVLLKAFGLIGWSWWWVFSPLWLPAAFYTACGLAALICLGIACAIIAIAERRADRWL